MLQQMAKFPSFILLNSIPLYIYIIHIHILYIYLYVHTHPIYIYHSLSQMPVDEHLDCFYVLTIINNASINNRVHVSF